MPFIPHTAEDVKLMLHAIGVDHVETLFEEIPPELIATGLHLPEAMGEGEVSSLMRQRASQDVGLLNFIGAGAYEHHIPAVVWELASRGEFYTAYTPYQAEASQGTLQILYEYQTMMASLTGMDCSNASLYEGASALAEAVLMAVRIQGGKSRRVLIPATVNPRYLATVRTLVQSQEIQLIEVPFCNVEGHTVPEALAPFEAQGYAALVIPQPNFFGILEEVDLLTDRVHGVGAMVIALVNPMATGMLSPPGVWGTEGADIACGEGQPLGAPLSSGGPYFGFLCCKTKHLRQMPGRIVGRTVDKHGESGFVLTLQAREQHIRRSKATSNICTNQGLLTVVAAIYLSVLGPEGLRSTAMACHGNMLYMVEQMEQIPGVERVFSRPFFHEVAFRLPRPVGMVLERLQGRGILGGHPLAGECTILENTLLLCVTETRQKADIQRYVTALREILA